MNTKILEYIVAVAEEKSITKAAERFYLSQPVLSRHIRKLERELGVPLFERTRDGMQLTEGGVIFVNNAQAILRREKKLHRQVTALRMKKKQRIRFVLDKPFHNFFVQRIVPIFRAQYPELQLEVTDAVNYLQVIKTVEEGGAEMGIYNQCPAVLPVEHNLASQLLLSDDLMMVLPGSYQGGMSFEELMDEVRRGRVPVLQDIGTTFRMAEEAHLAMAEVRPSTIMESGTFYNGLHIVLQNPQSCAYAPLEFREQCEEEGLRYSAPLLNFEATLLTAEDHTQSQPMRALTRLLQQEFQFFMDYCVRPYQEGSSYAPLN